MKNSYFQNLESDSIGTIYNLNSIIEKLTFNSESLIPVITQDFITREVLMLAWMNKESIGQTIKHKEMVYWSRTRNQLWHKGKTSSHVQYLISMNIDCDGDSLLCLVKQVGSACHTFRPSCFYLNVDLNKKHVLMNF